MVNAVEQAVVTAQSTLNPGQSAVSLALFKADGTPLVIDGAAAVAGKAQVTALTAITAPNAAAAAGANPTKAEYDVLVALANANKAATNAIIAALKA